MGSVVCGCGCVFVRERETDRQTDLLSGRTVDIGGHHPSCPLLRLHTGIAFIFLKYSPFIEPTDGQQVGFGERQTAFPSKHNNMPPPKSSPQCGLNTLATERWGLLPLSGVSVGM